MKFNEDTRVKIPVILHLVRLGYQYLSLKTQQWDKNTNIFPVQFHEAMARINPALTQDEINRLLQDISLCLDNEDLGKTFYEMLINRSGIKLIDFENFNNNSFHVVTELTYQNEDEEFRPDITLLINGLPLIFIEVKKPNNRKGMQDEYNRINRRFQNKKFRRFVNITQFMIFSNNMEYDENALQPIDGAFYASPSYHKLSFNYFREEDLNFTTLLKSLNEEQELVILKDNNLEVIRASSEFDINKDPNRPTNRICTSLVSRQRLAFILQYALAYVSERDGLQKHIMRYPQIFATKSIEERLNSNIKKGIVWHTQGSGKTALTYYNVRFLTDYFQKKQIIPKFYFIVDRIDLLEQAQREFTNRGLVVHVINSREQFSQEIKNQKAIHNHSGRPEITVVNIQKFKDDPDVILNNDYNLSIQRIYFLDEVHRSYKPTGSFLANLTDSDRDAIHIGLTGTPLLGDNNSRRLFGNYIHKYYYNASISDGYTLRLIREDIATRYKHSLQKAIDEIEVKQGEINRSLVYADPHFVEPMLDYIITDFETSRHAYNDASIGGMVICDSAEQAKQMFTIFNEKYAGQSRQAPLKAANESIYSVLKIEEPNSYYETKKWQNCRVNSAALILHDVGTKEDRKILVEEFKAGNIDFLFVYNMLLTGFDAKRLKKLYLGRIIRQHNLLQALTRVNRPYKNFRYGYVVDFADIRKEFDATNRAYFNELQEELGDEIEHYSHLFKSSEEIAAEIEHIKDVLFRFDCENAEIFSDQINQIDDKKTLNILKRALEDTRSLYNIIRLQQDYVFLTHLDFEKLNHLYRMTVDRLTTLNYKESIEQGRDDLNLINIALEDIIFEFIKVGEEELVLADEFKETLRKAREALSNNFDQEDSKFITLKEELERLFKKKNLREITQEEMKQNIPVLNHIYQRIKELNRQNELLRKKYQGDRKYTRLHKRLLENHQTQASERNIYEALFGVKQNTDDLVLRNLQILDNESYFKRMVMPNIIEHFVERQNINLSINASDYLNQLIVNEYLKEFNYGAYSW
ncbi:type I restriction endonuclease subunit R [Gilliamella sp. Pas-s27]|uniref:type I restriction endonuclease subunit R n=1 Tax=Gilliamella sp. Pas-s27 TaxID=2687311 RepID=UPI001365DBFB|nr:type I restriction endonuclease [Gilliamella sp. Pas-s27]MWP46681.1 type I restriction endonuclease subunit R [Gilliamella sp. Pas-s27]